MLDRLKLVGSRDEFSNIIQADLVSAISAKQAERR